MAVLYNMRAIAQSSNEYVFWTDSEPDLDGSSAPEAVVLDSISIYSISSSASLYNMRAISQSNSEYVSGRTQNLTLMVVVRLKLLY